MRPLLRVAAMLALGASTMLPVAALSQFDPTLVPAFTIWGIKFG